MTYSDGAPGATELSCTRAAEVNSPVVQAVVPTTEGLRQMLRTHLQVVQAVIPGHVIEPNFSRTVQ